jgi:hypothetical protein
VIDMADRRVDLEDGAIVRLGVRNGREWAYASEQPQSRVAGARALARGKSSARKADPSLRSG